MSLLKISSGIALTDEDRWPWLDAMRFEIDQHLQSRSVAVMVNSALRRAYRERLGIPQEGVQLIYLKGTAEQALQNNRSRRGHFAPEATVVNNFRILEPPLPEENAWVVDYDERGVDQTFARLLAYLQ